MEGEEDIIFTRRSVPVSGLKWHNFTLGYAVVDAGRVCGSENQPALQWREGGSEQWGCKREVWERMQGQRRLASLCSTSSVVLLLIEKGFICCNRLFQWPGFSAGFTLLNQQTVFLF